MITCSSADCSPSSSRNFCKCNDIWLFLLSCVCCSAVCACARLRKWNYRFSCDYFDWLLVLLFLFDFLFQFPYCDLFQFIFRYFNYHAFSLGPAVLCSCFSSFNVFSLFSNCFVSLIVSNSSCHFLIMSALNFSSNCFSLNVLFVGLIMSFKLTTNLLLEGTKSFEKKKRTNRKSMVTFDRN